jgi:hypothetical protein
MLNKDPDRDDPPPRFDDDWYPPQEMTPEMRRWAKENAQLPPDETGTQPYWRETLTKEKMPTTGPAPEGPTSDTAQLPPPFAPPVDPQKYNVDVPAPMPGQTGGTMDKGRINKLPPAAPKVPGTQDQPSEPKGFFSPPPPDPDEILYTGRHLGGHLGAVNV